MGHGHVLEGASGEIDVTEGRGPHLPGLGGEHLVGAALVPGSRETLRENDLDRVQAELDDLLLLLLALAFDLDQGLLLEADREVVLDPREEERRGTARSPPTTAPPAVPR